VNAVISGVKISGERILRRKKSFSERGVSHHSLLVQGVLKKKLINASSGEKKTYLAKM
jgi:hypothetical protein